MKYHTDGLQKRQISVLKDLSPHMSSRGFYLAGGTALAIHLAHRVSVDLDWFTSHPFEDELLLAECIRSRNIDLNIEQVSPGTFHGSVHGVLVTFLQYQYTLLKPLGHWDEMDCSLASLEDLS